jgi:hypothetical protein
MRKYKISTRWLGWTRVTVLKENGIYLESWLCPSVKSAIEQINIDSVIHNGSPIIRQKT